MACGPGEWAELVRTVPGAATGTGFLGGLDLELDSGERVRGVDRGAVVPSGPAGATGSSSGIGGRLLEPALAVLAGLVIVVVLVWLRWGR